MRGKLVYTGRTLNANKCARILHIWQAFVQDHSLFLAKTFGYKAEGKAGQRGKMFAMFRETRYCRHRCDLAMPAALAPLCRTRGMAALASGGIQLPSCRLPVQEDAKMAALMLTLPAKLAEHSRLNQVQVKTYELMLQEVVAYAEAQNDNVEEFHDLLLH